MFCPSGCFVPPDVLSLRMFFPSGCFLPTDVFSQGCYVSGRFVSRTFCLSGSFVPADVLFLSLWAFFPSGRFVAGHYVTGYFVSGRFVWLPHGTVTTQYHGMKLIVHTLNHWMLNNCMSNDPTC
jgi:hypothetical protein